VFFWPDPKRVDRHRGAYSSRPQLILIFDGTAFQERVWKALRSIPPGKTASYSQIARKIGAPKSMRAVAGACAANKLAVVIPCHRVVRNDSSPSGYA
jgi:AraC family transcriptional regulator, regulatory protein of adaptative response / methylated-DNA-[protein]-cysteine methyltransferase